MKLPRLNDDTETLFKLYHGRQVVCPKDLSEAFSISKTKAIAVIDAVGRCPNTMGINIRISKLFEAYGWDMNKINKTMKIKEEIHKTH